mmetsp:Transcript_35369/g.104609  ORF Transcript_35369/g.104609 Transcript_35369/m.104609 type:complete len:329 (-) Transcript_35369:652-1638(-)
MAEALLDKSLDDIVQEKAKSVAGKTKTPLKKARGGRGGAALAKKKRAAPVAQLPSPSGRRPVGRRARQRRNQKEREAASNVAIPTIQNKKIWKQEPVKSATSVITAKRAHGGTKLVPVQAPTGYVPVQVRGPPPGWVPVQLPSIAAPFNNPGPSTSVPFMPVDRPNVMPVDRPNVMSRMSEAAPFDMGPPPYKGKVVAAPGCKILISNLHYVVTESDLKELFNPWPLVCVNVDYDASGRSLGTASVIMTNPAHARDAVSRYKGKALDGKEFVLKVADHPSETRLSSGISFTPSRGAQSAQTVGGRGHGPGPRGRSTRVRSSAVDMMQM